MNIEILCRKIIDRIYNRIWLKTSFSSKILCNYVKKNIGDKNIWLLGVPRSRNLGDHAQVLCSYAWFAENYPGYRTFAFDSGQLLRYECMLLEFISNNLQKDDLIFFQSGYNLTDMYPFEEQMHRETVKRINNNRIVFLPQTISFKKPYESNQFVQESLKLYQNNKNVYLLCRDKMSYKIAKEALPGVMSYPFPDIVTTLIGRTTFEKKQRKGVLLCARHDEEGIFSKENLLFLKKSLEQIDYVDTIDTTIEAPSQLFIRRNREKYVYKMINLMHDHKVVVTDRYHGLIFSIVANTPVVLLKTIDHKITEGVNWFPEEIRRYICFAETLEEAADLVKKLSEGHKFIADDYFYKKYYSELKNLFDDINSWLAED